MDLNFEKDNGLIPVIVQHANTLQVLMLAYMNEEALRKTQETKWVTFYSRSKKRLWTKGESSGNKLALVSLQTDCDQDALLVKALPKGPTCHTGSFSCFGKEENQGFIYQLEHIISERIAQQAHGSYTVEIFNEGINKIAQKVGEEAVETVIASKDSNDELFRNEVADLLYHLLLLLRKKEMNLSDIEGTLMMRNSK